jgi:hypothetical protein
MLDCAAVCDNWAGVGWKLCYNRLECVGSFNVYLSGNPIHLLHDSFLFIFQCMRFVQINLHCWYSQTLTHATLPLPTPKCRPPRRLVGAPEVYPLSRLVRRKPPRHPSRSVTGHMPSWSPRASCCATTSTRASSQSCVLPQCVPGLSNAQSWAAPTRSRSVERHAALSPPPWAAPPNLHVEIPPTMLRPTCPSARLMLVSPQLVGAPPPPVAAGGENVNFFQKENVNQLCHKKCECNYY